jgi:hypothetical protein
LALSAKEWLDELERRFTADTREQWEDQKERPCDPRPRNQVLDTLWSYYAGDPPLPTVSAEFQDIFRDTMRKSRSNLAEMSVSAVVARMELQSVATPTDKDANGDDTANDIMENCGFQTRFKDIEIYKSVMGEAFGMVVAPREGAVDDLPTIHAIDPRVCVGIPDPENPVRLRAALIKEFDLETNSEIRHLFLPGKKWLIRKDQSGKWVEPQDDSPDEKITGIDELGGIPIVRFLNPLGQGEYAAHLDLLDRIIDITLQLMVLMKFQAFKQTAAIGDEDEEDEYDDENTDYGGEIDPQPLIGGNPNPQAKNWDDVFKAGPGAVWKLPAGWQMWQGQATDATGMIQAKRDAQKEFAAVSHTPLYLISPDDANGSAQGAGLLREAITSKVRDRRVRDSPSVKLLWRIAFAMVNRKVKPADITLTWGPLEFKALAEKGAATLQVNGILPTKKIYSEIWEWTPEEIVDALDALNAQKLQDAITAQLTAPTPAPSSAAASDQGQPQTDQQQPPDDSTAAA